MNKILKTIILLSFSQGVWAQGGDKPFIKEPSFKTDTVSIEAFGAKGDGIQLNTASINQTIDRVHQQGGGVVLIPAGVWLSGPILLKSNVNLHLKENALLQFTKDFDQYPIVETNWEGVPQMRNQSPIWAKGQENIAITGKGLIDGNGDAWRMVKKSKMTESQWDKLLASGGVLNEKKDIWYPSEKSLKGASMKDAGHLSASKDRAFFEGIKDFLRPNMILIESCRNVLLDGVTFQNSAAWNIHPLMTNNLIIRNLTVRNPWYSQNGDGLDIESCQNVLVENSSFDVGDDAICIKSGRDKLGRERGMPTQDLWVRNCTVYHAHGGFVIGSEMSGGAKNLHVDHCTFIGTDIGLRFKTTRGRGGIVEDIDIHDIYMKDIPGEAILFDMYYEAKDPIALKGEHREPPKVETLPVSEETPQFRNFTIRNIVCDGAAKALFIRGLPEMAIQQIDLSDLVIRADEGIDIQEASDIHLKNVTLSLNPTISQTAYFLNSKQVNIDQLKVQQGAPLFLVQGPRTKGIQLKGVTGVRPSVKAEYGASQQEVKVAN